MAYIDKSAEKFRSNRREKQTGVESPQTGEKPSDKEAEPKATEKKKTMTDWLKEIFLSPNTVLIIVLSVVFLYSGAYALGDLAWDGPIKVIQGIGGHEGVAPFARLFIASIILLVIIRTWKQKKDTWNLTCTLLLLFILFFGLIGFIRSFDPGFDWREKVKEKTVILLSKIGGDKEEDEYEFVWKSRPGYPKTFTGQGYDKKSAIVIATIGKDWWRNDKIIISGPEFAIGRYDMKKNKKLSWVNQSSQKGLDIHARSAQGVKFRVDIQYKAKVKK